MIELIIIENNIALADSRVVAEELGVQHGDFFSNIIRKYQEEVENDFGVIRFENGKPLRGSLGGRPERYALLTETQVNTYMAYSRNTDKARACKRKLVKAFDEAKGIIAQMIAHSQAQSPRHHINQDYYQRLKINRDLFEPSRFTILEVLDNLSLKWGYDLFELTERCRPDISWGQVFMDCLRDEGYNVTIDKPGSEITRVEHVVDIKTMLKKKVNSFPNKWYGFNLDCFGEIYVANHLPKYLRGKTPDGKPRMDDPETAIADLQKRLAYTYQHRLF